MTFVVREYHGQSWSERRITVEIHDFFVHLYVDGYPMSLNPEMAEAVAKGLQAAAESVKEVIKAAHKARIEEARK